MKASDGGPAQEDVDTRATQGMSLRDWFAGTIKITEDDFPDSTEANNVVVGFNCPKDRTGDYRSTEDPIAWLKWVAALEAKIRYIKADAMVAEREKQVASSPTA